MENPPFVDHFLWLTIKLPHLFLCLPSGNLTWLLKITMFNGKIHYNWPFSIAMLNYQRVLFTQGFVHRPDLFTRISLWNPVIFISATMDFTHVDFHMLHGFLIIYMGGSSWKLFPPKLSSLGFSFEIPFLHVVHWFSMGFSWVFHGFFMGFLIFHGFPWFFMAFHGLAMDLPWICHGFSTGFPHRRSGHPPGFVHPQRPPAPLVSAAMRRAADRPQQRSETNGHLIGDKFGC